MSKEISTYDFRTLCVKIDHEDLVGKLNNINFAFKGWELQIYLV